MVLTASGPGAEVAEREQLLALAKLVRRRIGVDIDDARLPLLAAAVARIRPRLRPEDLLRLVGDPQAGDWAFERLVDQVTVRETRFFRHPAELAGIDWAPGLRLWNPGCATGEESYTLAMMALDARAGVGATVSILATDVAAAALERAREFRYAERSLRGMPASSRERHLEAVGTRFEVSEAARRMVRVARHNLVADPFPPVDAGRFDVIVCRNVLIYFDADTSRRVVAALRRALVPGGQLVLGAADRLSAPPAHGETVPAPPAPRPRPRVRPWSRSPRAVTAAAPVAGSLDPCAHFVHGLALKAAGDLAGSVVALRRAVYLAPDFARAAFELARDHEALGDTTAARRAYQQTLWALDSGPASERWPDDGEPADLRPACHRSLDRLDREERRR